MRIPPSLVTLMGLMDGYMTQAEPIRMFPSLAVLTDSLMGT